MALPEVEILDLAGPLQAFHEANRAGARFRVHVCGISPTARSEQGVTLSDLEPLPEPLTNDLVVVPGVRLASMGVEAARAAGWIRRAHDGGARIASVCTGAFVLADAGLLAGRQCTTHWSRVDDLARRVPSAQVLRNRLFVRDGRVITSAGIASGIDMALWLIEEADGPLVAAAAAREMVVYLRRDGAHGQRSVYLEYRTHLHAGVHRVQDWLVAHPSEPATLAELGRVAAMSPRNLTRAFRRATGISVQAFRSRVRLELARGLLNDPALTVEGVARQCGFDSARQLRRLWREAYGTSPGAGRGKRLRAVGAVA
ncbi:MAG TPA: helix-turn-helix domain-containing protein [Gemmatimonadales bacterium]|nr:helix-turn-helix domain-containing protein [Gemmatimonadales bacterium]